MIAGVLSLSAAVASADEVVWPNSAETVAGNTFSCAPLTGCDGAVRFQQAFDRSQFGGIGAVLITGMRFRPDEGKWPFVFHQITDAEINLGTTANGPNGLSSVFADNFNTTSVQVYSSNVSGPLTLSSSASGPGAGPKDFDIEVLFDTEFSFDPADGDLLVEFKNLSVDIAKGKRQYVDAQTRSGPASCRVRIWSEPTGGGNKSASPQAETANRGDCVGIVVEFVYRRANPTSGENLLAPEGVNVPVADFDGLFEKIAAGVEVPGFTDVDICVAKDPREVFSGATFQRYFQQHQPFSGLIPKNSSCAFLARSTLRFPPWARGHRAQFTDAQGSVEHGVYFIIVHSESDSTLVLNGAVGVTGFHEFFADNFDILGYALSFSPAPACNTDLRNRWLTMGVHPEQPNTDLRSVSVRCNRSFALVQRTDVAFPMRQDTTMNDENSTVQQQINEINAAIQDAAQCVNGAAAPVIALMQSELQAVHNGFTQGRYADARLAAEQIARHSEHDSNEFSGCSLTENFKGRVTALAMTLAFTLFDRWEHPAPGPTWEIYDPPADLDLPGL
jgi:hypothetical protein